MGYENRRIEILGPFHITYADDGLSPLPGKYLCDISIGSYVVQADIHVLTAWDSVSAVGTVEIDDGESHVTEPVQIVDLVAGPSYGTDAEAYGVTGGAPRVNDNRPSGFYVRKEGLGLYFYVVRSGTPTQGEADVYVVVVTPLA